MSRSEERRKARERGGSDMTKFYVILGVVAVVGIGAVGYSLGSSALGAAAMEPIEVEGLDDMTVRAEMAQGATKGDDDAPVTILEFGDYACAAGGRFVVVVLGRVGDRFGNDRMCREVHNRIDIVGAKNLLE